MRSNGSIFRKHIGDTDLRGKKTHTFGCLCCNMVNFKDEYFTMLAEKEIEEAMNHPLYEEAA